MLPAANRLRSAADFSETTRRGRKVTRGCVVVYARLDESLAQAGTPPRLGLIVGKIVGNSVQRHRAARRIRGAMAPQVSALPAGTRVVVRALRGADTDPGLATDLATALQSAVTTGRG